MNEDKSFELIVSDESKQILNGDVPVRWCVTPELVKRLENEKIIDPHILLLTANSKNREVQRQLVPITELMTYVRFTQSGENNLYGFIINGKCGRKELVNTFIRKVNNYYKTDILMLDDDAYGYIPNEYCRTKVIVHIPEGVFGKEPGEWMKWFVNMWHYTSRVTDECHYRRRLVLAFSLKWFPVLIWTILLVIGRVSLMGTLALSGYYKGIKLLRCFRPFKWNNIQMHLIDDISFKENPFLIKRKYINKYGIKQPYLLSLTVPFLPLILLIQSFVVFIFFDYFVQTMLIITSVLFSLFILVDTIEALKRYLIKIGLLNKIGNYIDNKAIQIASLFDINDRWKYLRWIIYACWIIIILSLTYYSIILGIYVIFIGITAFLLIKYHENILTRLNNVYTIAPESNDYTEIRELLCPSDEQNLKPDIRYIPPKQRTVRLRYLDLKNKICKPMQR